MSLFWLSFCDPERPEGEQFTGVALVEVEGEGVEALRNAVNRAWATGCNPGGEIRSIEFTDAALRAMPNTMRVDLAKAPRETLMDKALLLHYDLIAEKEATDDDER